jgi:membrane-bound ClpP family serine protease
MSAGTLICLATNEIVMSAHAVLGPIEPQLGEFPAASLLKMMEQSQSPRLMTKRSFSPSAVLHQLLLQAGQPLLPDPRGQRQTIRL